MSNYINLIKTIKQAAVEAVETQKPAAVLFGTVQSENPLSIFINQKMILEADEIILTRNVTDFETDMTVNHFTQNTAGGFDAASFESHNHAYKGRKTFLIHNALKSGDKVILLRVQGGQRFVVIDRVG